jgi:hypothetical protein
VKALGKQFMKTNQIDTATQTNNGKQVWSAPSLVVLSLATDTLNMSNVGDDGGGGGERRLLVDFGVFEHYLKTAFSARLFGGLFVLIASSPVLLLHA